MIMETVGNFQWAVQDSKNVPFLNLTIKKISENKTVSISDVVWATGREDFLSVVYDSAIETLGGADHCCYQGKVCLVEDI